MKVIETCLVGQLREIMDPMSILKLDDGATERLAGETGKHRHTREKLQAKLKALGNGNDSRNKLAAPFCHGKSDDYKRFWITPLTSGSFGN